jgi:hypothetical protein
VSWDVFARNAVAALRLEAGKRPHDRRLHHLIDELRAADVDVAAWWDDHAVRDYASVTKHIRHPEAGDLVFGIEAIEAPYEPNQRLTIYTVEPDSPTARVLPIPLELDSRHRQQHLGHRPYRGGDRLSRADVDGRGSSPGNRGVLPFGVGAGGTVRPEKSYPHYLAGAVLDRLSAREQVEVGRRERW